MLDLLVDLVDRASGRCAYAEARHVRTDDEHLLVRNGKVDRDGLDAAAVEGDAGRGEVIVGDHDEPTTLPEAPTGREATA